ncbi:chorismate mutase [Taklimakanibacter lacteus]|uniref:chorismate mutase n=1 Tax=Taklimakanibacter lacteus TaxID=2268456 RepID=UPI0034D68706
MMSKQPPKPSSSLADLRREIDALDAELVLVLARRQRCVERVIEIKRAQNLPARLPDRIDEVLKRVSSLAAAQKLDPDLAAAVWREMIEQFIAFEERILKH